MSTDSTGPLAKLPYAGRKTAAEARRRNKAGMNSGLRSVYGRNNNTPLVRYTTVLPSV